MAKKTYLHKGLVAKLDEQFAKVAGFFDLERWFRDMAKKLKIAFYDECCPEASGLDQPIKFDSDMDQLVRFTNGQWTQIPTSLVTGVTGTTGTFTITTGTVITVQDGIITSVV